MVTNKLISVSLVFVLVLELKYFVTLIKISFLFLFCIYLSMQHQQSYRTVTLFSQPYLDSSKQCYKNIVTTNLLPQGPLMNFVCRIQFPPLSTFKIPSKQCGLALFSLKRIKNLMITDEVPSLFSYLLSNGYSIDTSITRMLNDSDLQFDMNIGNKIIAIITYNG